MTGLAQGSSVVVRFRTYLEIFPQWGEGNGFIRLASRTVPYSPIIDEILTRVLAEMPAGTAYTDNPLGEWFERMLSGVAEYAPQVGDALGMIFPPAKLIGNGLGGVARGLGGTIAMSRKKSESQNNNQASSSNAQANKAVKELTDAKRVIRELSFNPAPGSSAQRLRVARKKLLKKRR